MKSSMQSLWFTAIRPQSQAISLRVRRFNHGDNPNLSYTERDGRHVFDTLETSTSRLALILVDVWAHHHIKGWEERAEDNIRTRLLPLVQTARANGILVIHCLHGELPNPLVKPLPNEPIVDGLGEERRLLNLLRERKIKYLLYAGYASNKCVLARPIGLIKMSQCGYGIIFVRDASLAIEAPEFLNGETTHGVVTYMVETNWGMTTNVEDIVASFNGAKSRSENFLC